ncbi:Peptidase S41 family protein [Lasiodiplodia theobromae]|uniref:Peptidase S41 family protein n=1 Tax=Lasiodiplodia theobromae TaxID=45133 RepID=UPI0015C39D0E|nr:Peptidase S41 family protein [Lasiodiplodia theobromae]KAF4541939.1 Peptidase S41 family protein [Lasiodiplodia theobromae]
MRSFASVAALSCLSLGALAKPTPRPAPVEIQTNEDASDAPWDICGRIVSAANEGQYIFYARDAIRCLTSVPFNAAVASRFIEYYNTTIQFQSTLAYLKNPPEGYQQPAIDVVAGLQQIQDNIDNGKYKNQYAFEAEMQALVYSMHDMHVDLNSGVLSAFSFASPYYITSASVDGKQDPQIYLWNDVWERAPGDPEPSAIATINGRDVIEVLTEFAALNSQGTLEPHADWNQLFSSPAQDIQGTLNVFSGGATFYPGDELEFRFKDGSNITTNWIAIYNNPYDTGPLTTGGDFYNYFVLRQYPQAYYDALEAAANSTSTDDSSSDDTSDDSTSDDTSSDDTTSDDTSSDDTSGNWNYDSYGAYPDNPDIVQPNLSIESGGVLTGYFFNESSTAVLSIPSFDQYDDNIGLFDETVGHFVNNATARNLTRCVIDLQQNSGGLTLLAFITFAWFFPQTTPFHGSRRRSFDLANSLGSFTTDFWSSLQPGTDDYDDWYDSLASDEWVVTDRLDADTGLNFTSWSAFYGPRHYNDDDFSLTEQYNLSSPVFADTAFNGWFLDPEQWGTAPWRPDQILLLTDGTCSSTCALFVELMTQQIGVRTLAVGGRPGAGPMQTASGSRGALEYTANDIDIDIDWVNGRMDLNDNAGNESAYGNLRPLRERDSGMWVSYAGFNLRDQIRENDTVPLQFKYEAANCRMYYTLDNVWNMTRLWLDAAAATWDDISGGSCVANSTGYSSTSSVSTAQPPPPLNISVPTINDDFLSNTADYVISSADADGEDAGNHELTAGTAAVSSTTLQLCTSAGKCPAGLTGTCEEIQIQCPGAKTAVTRNVCMTRCSSVNRGADCSASGTGCTGLDSGRNNRLTSTSNSGSTGSSLAKEFNRNVGRGYCKPKITPVKGSSAVKALACPK